MKTQYKNINEQIARMKSLFTEERLYGNLVEQEVPVIASQKGEPTIDQDGNYIITYSDDSQVIYVPQENKWKKKADAATDMVDIDITSADGKKLVTQYEATRNADKNWVAQVQKIEKEKKAAALIAQNEKDAIIVADAIKQGYTKEVPKDYETNKTAYVIQPVRNDADEVEIWYKRGGTIAMDFGETKKRKCRKIISDQVEKFSIIRGTSQQIDYIDSIETNNDDVLNIIEKMRWCISNFGKDEKDARFLKKDNNTTQFTTLFTKTYGEQGEDVKVATDKPEKTKKIKPPKGGWYRIDDTLSIKYEGGDNFVVKGTGTIAVLEKGTKKKIFRQGYPKILHDILTQARGSFAIDGKRAFKDIDGITVDEIKKDGSLVKIRVAGETE